MRREEYGPWLPWQSRSWDILPPLARLLRSERYGLAVGYFENRYIGGLRPQTALKFEQEGIATLLYSNEGVILKAFAKQLSFPGFHDVLKRFTIHY